jgi:hypothetical protein
MTETKIRKRLAGYCKTCDIKKVKAIYTIVEDEIEEAASGWDEEFIKEIERREKSFMYGSAKMYSCEEAKQAGIDRVKAKKIMALSFIHHDSKNPKTKFRKEK